MDFNEEIGLAHSHFYRSKMESPATHFRTSLADTLYVMFWKVCRTISTKSRRFIHYQNLRLHGDWQAVHIFSIGNRQVDVQCQPNASDVARESRSIVDYSPRLYEITMCKFQICWLCTLWASRVVRRQHAILNYWEEDEDVHNGDPARQLSSSPQGIRKAIDEQSLWIYRPSQKRICNAWGH